jgi:hypothetical protein
MRSPLDRKFRPKADAAKLRELWGEAWQARYDAVFTPQERDTIAARLIEHLEGLYPPADMPVLARYRVSSECKEVYVSIHDDKTGRWDHSAAIPLPRPVIVPTSYCGLHCGGPRYSRDPMRGLKAESMAEIKAGKWGGWEHFCADQDRTEARRVPEELEPFFQRIVTERAAYKTENQKRDEIHAGMTWRDVVALFSFTGNYLRTALEADCA